ncbi:hypothetical protein IU449_05620 [Nocardia higoensis]|uniref:Uncharacterized protein n=1 Tax=Nocardia higoensis TaxID=228599 RepID=A0ABS0D6D4_9NOCA|nr:hypothetical protein [Nocardia higoensis]MBF6354034.1 hypothetical protein [Nocardia higoensis]
MDTALGLLNLDLSESPLADRATLHELAARHGYHLTTVLTIDENTYMPTTLIAHTAHTTRAATILAPGLAHFGCAVRALTLSCALVVPDAVIPRIPGWTPNP